MKKSEYIFLSILSITGLGLTGCTVMLPPSEENIPAADPIILPGKATTIPVDNRNTKATEIKANNAGTGKPSNVPVNTTSNVIATTPPATSSTTANDQTHYVVKPKDTVFEVMRQTGVHWKEIIKLNNLKAPNYVIHPGQSLRIR